MTRVSPEGHRFDHPDPVYTPAEDSWLLARVLAEAGPWTGARAADVGAGTGVQAVTLAAEGAGRVVATDRVREAVACTRANAAENGHQDRIDAVQANLLDPIASGSLDVVACNPPYLPESGAVTGAEAAALEAGDDGIAVARAFVADLARVLAPDGVAYLLASTRGDLEALDEAIGEAGLAGEVVAEEPFPFERLQVRRLERR